MIEEEEHHYVTLVCKDDEEIIVPDYIAFHSGFGLSCLSNDCFVFPRKFPRRRAAVLICVIRLIKRIFDGHGNFRETEEHRVALPAFSGRVIEKIFAYSFEDFLLNEGHRHTGAARRRLFNDDLTEDDEDDFNSLAAYGTPPNSLAGSLISTSASPPHMSGFAMISSSPPLSGFLPSKSPISGRTYSSHQLSLSSPFLLPSFWSHPDSLLIFRLNCHSILSLALAYP